MPRSLRLALAGCLLAALVSVLGGAPAVIAEPVHSGVVAVAKQARPNNPDNPNNPGNRNDNRGGNGNAVQPGPDLQRQEQEADQQVTQNKAIIGTVAAVLLLIVFFGRRSRNKYRRKVKNLKNAKA